MPTYDYECSACGHTFEKFQSIKAPAIRRCPQCSQRKVKRLIGAGGGIIFKGSGFYETDYRSDSYRKSAEKDKPSSSSDSSSDSKSESKSDTKSDGSNSTKSDSNSKSSPSSDK